VAYRPENDVREPGHIPSDLARLDGNKDRGPRRRRLQSGLAQDRGPRPHPSGGRRVAQRPLRRTRRQLRRPHPSRRPIEDVEARGLLSVGERPGPVRLDFRNAGGVRLDSISGRRAREP
ncbi:hypothetical protein BVRB_032760, partial [Beta vulgaris subsp. vulgaris]